MRNDPAFLLYYARVLLREAHARQGTAFARSLVEWAGRARREAMAIKAAPAKGHLDLFDRQEAA